MPHLPMNTAKGDTIGLSSGNANRGGAEEDTYLGRGSQWEDEEERKFYEDLTDLKDLLPKSICTNTESTTNASASGDAGGAGDGEADESEETHLERLGDVDDAEEEAVEEECVDSARPRL